MLSAAFLALLPAGSVAPQGDSFAETLRREIEDLWGNLAGVTVEEAPSRDKSRFFYYYEAVKKNAAPTSRDLEEATEAVRALDARYGSEPSFRWRCDELLALLTWDLGRRREGIERYRAALDGYPAENYPEPNEQSAFQHVANELAGRIADESGIEAAVEFVLDRFREDPRFVYFHFPYWERRLGEADDYERFEGMRERVLAIYREKAERDEANRSHLSRYAADLESERRPVGRRAGGDPRKRYFLLVPPGTDPDDTRHLVLMIPGGPGPARPVLPFLTDLHAAVGRRYVFAVLSPPHWSEEQARRDPWPTDRSRARSREIGFSTEAFLRAVLEDLRSTKAYAIDRVFVFGWSSGGPAVYAAATDREAPYDGYYTLSSRFDPADLGLEAARGRRFYIQHGAKDEIVPLLEAKGAAESLRGHGAEVRLDAFEGGHGFGQPDPKYAVRLALSWLETGD